jgi:hypothetical protein
MSIFGSIKEKITKYIEVNTQLIKLTLISKAAGLMSYFMFGIIILLIVFCITLFLGFGLTEALMLSGLTKVTSFFITVGAYALLLIIVLQLRKPITRFFASGIINDITAAEKREEEEKD